MKILNNFLHTLESYWICPYCDDHFPEREIIYKEKVNDEWKCRNGNSIFDSEYCPNP